MDDLISRQAAIDALGEEPEVWAGSEDEVAARGQWRIDKAAIEAVPTAEKKGEWIPVVDGNYIIWECSECHVESDAWTDYCPNCGARMEESDG